MYILTVAKVVENKDLKEPPMYRRGEFDDVPERTKERVLEVEVTEEEWKLIKKGVLEIFK